MNDMELRQFCITIATEIAGDSTNSVECVIKDAIKLEAYILTGAPLAKSSQGDKHNQDVTH